LHLVWLIINGMKKLIFLFLFGLMFFQTTKAQRQDTLAYYMKYGNTLAQNKQDADYLLIIFPADSSSGKVLYPIVENYINGHHKSITSSLTNDRKALKYDGQSIDFFENGHRKSIYNQKNGKLDGDFTNYYPNGQIFQIGKNTNDIRKLIECRDSTGKVLAENGTGQWIEFDYKFKEIEIQGTIKDSLKEGEWKGMDINRVACITKYKKGVFISGTYYFKSGKTFHYNSDGFPPAFGNGGPLGFNEYLANTVKYPDEDKKAGRSGKVIITFVVERDGSLTDVKALRSPDEAMADAAIEAIEKSPPWVPGIQNGIPVRVQFTIAFGFNL